VLSQPSGEVRECTGVNMQTPDVSRIVVFHRLGPRAEWVRIGEARSMREALDMASGSGDWWLHTNLEQDAGGLFNGRELAKAG
jgi:hypothetical protein